MSLISTIDRICIFAGLFTLGVQAQAERPNIILIFMDDLGHNDIGVNTFPSREKPYPEDGPTPMLQSDVLPSPNEARLLTPAIDRIADEGIHMTNFYSTSICSPSRAMLMSGRYARRSDIYRVFFPNSEDGFSTEEVTLPEKLREAGYHTSMVGKWHLGYNRNERLSFQMMPTRHGFQDFYGVPYSNDMNFFSLIDGETVLDPDVSPAEKQAELTWLLTERALERIETSSKDESPFFLFFSHPMTHIPCWPSDREFTNADGTTWPKFQGQSGVSYYYDVVMEVNHSTQRILDKLDQLDIADNTLVIFTSDNGPWSGLKDKNLEDRSVSSAYPFRGAKMSTWDGGVRVPLLARWPGRISAGHVSASVGGLTDLLPTLVALGGGELPEDRIVDGIDLWPIWAGQTNTIDRVFALHEAWNENWQTIRRGNWKLRQGKLYNLAEDIQESNDLSDDPNYADIRQSLQTELQQLIESAREDNVERGSYSDFEVEFNDNDIHIAKGGMATVKLRLSHKPEQNVDVKVERFSGNPDLSVQSGSDLRFTPDNWDSWQSVKLTAAKDAEPGHLGATFRVTMDAHPVVRELFAFID